MKTILTEFSQQKSCTSTVFCEACEEDEVPCFACFNSVKGEPTYFLDTQETRYYFHKSCAELPAKIQHPLHLQHPLTLHHHSSFFVCEGCSLLTAGFRYRCKECRFNLNVPCASKFEDQVWKPSVETHTVYHRHKLQLVHSLPEFFKFWACCCCQKSCINPFYICKSCIGKDPFVIHKHCLDTLPRQVQSSFHPEHALFIRRFRPTLTKVRTCSACGEIIEGVGLTCGDCRLRFHVSCGRQTRQGLRLENLHEHEMH